MKNRVSPEVEVQGMRIAKGTQKMGQTKEQTKLVAQGIEKGIAEYKKQQGKKLREIDKQRKQKIKQRDNKSNESIESTETIDKVSTNTSLKYLPWILLVLSWLGFATYIAL